METTDYLVPMYIVYAGCALALTIWLAHTLYKNGAVFLEEVFDRKEIAVAVNRLLVTGFFMINLGYAMFLLKSNEVRQLPPPVVPQRHVPVEA